MDGAFWGDPHHRADGNSGRFQARHSPLAILNGENWWKKRAAAIGLHARQAAISAPTHAHGHCDVEDLVIQVRDHYVAEFRAFIRRQQAACTTGAAEVKFSLGADTAAFHRLAVVDFVRNDDGAKGVLFEPESFLTFDRIKGNIATTALVIEGLRWDATVIRHNVPRIDSAIEEWFLKWFDPDETRFDHAAELSNCIHAVYIEPNELQVDFGTAPADAFWELLDSLAYGNATSVNVR